MPPLQFPLAPQPGEIYPIPAVPGLPSYMWDDVANRWAGRAGGTMGPVVNVLDYGADPTTTRDSTAALQAAFDAAFGPASSPHGDLTKNRPLYIPKGRYFVTAPLRATNVRGGQIFGEARLQTRLDYNGPAGASGTIVPLLHFDSACDLQISNLGLNSLRADTVNDPTSMAIVHWDSSQGPCTGNLVWAVSASGPVTGQPVRYGLRGFLHISTAGGYENARNLYIHATVDYLDCAFLISGPKSHDINFIGSGATYCNPCIRVENGGHVGMVTALSSHRNKPDIEMFGASGPLAILGTRSESPWLLATDGQAYVVGHSQTAFYTTINGSSNGTTLTVTAADGYIEPGCAIWGSDGVNSYPIGQVDGEQLHTTIVAQLSGSTYQTSTAAQPGDISNGTIYCITQAATVLEGGHVTFDGGNFAYGNAASWIRGAAGSSVAIRQANTVSGWMFGIFAGQITEYTTYPRRLDELPNPAMCQGLVVAVSDSDVPANATTYGQPAQGGGSNTVRAMSDGVTWRIA